ncbi:UNVERIFIED_CONTAM: hypothetical protein Sradi_2081000 [Sesamum radiatum]|uniref:DUF4283 domain-containing protein n=1 Tax=Sesamum radiatum TaxID=300843 RepID=A0AAW2TI76_SESRA
MEDVIDGGPWLFQGQPIVLQWWERGLSLRKHSHMQVPIWIKLKHLPVELWIEAGLSTVASGVGKPLYTDIITRSCARLDYARVCVMLDYNAKLPKHIVVLLPSNDEGQTAPCKVDVEYEWIPCKCVRCRALGHSQANCPLNKDSKKPPVNVYVPRKVQVVQPHATRIDQSNKNGHGINLGTQNQEAIHSDVVGASVDDVLLPSLTTISPHQGKGKEIVLYDPFLPLFLEGETGKSPWGPNERSPNASFS